MPRLAQARSSSPLVPISLCSDEGLTFEKAQTLRGLIQACPKAVVALNHDGRVEMWNQAAVRIFGWAEEEVLGGPLPFIPPSAATEARALLSRVYSGESLQGVELERIRKDGNMLTISLSCAPVLSKAGEITGLMATIEDISERKKAEAELARLLERERAIRTEAEAARTKLMESEERLRMLASALPAIVWSIDSSSKPDFINDRLFEYAGLDRVTYRPNDWQSTIHPDDMAPLKEQWRSAAEEQRPMESSFRIRRADGVFRWHLARMVPLVSPAGGVVRWFGTATDIECQKHTEAELQESLALIHSWMDAAPVGLCHFDRDLRFHHVNRAMAEANSRPVEAHLGKTLREVVPELADRLEPLYQQVLKTGEAIRNAEVEGVPPGSSELRHWLVHYYPVKTDSGEILGVGTVCLEITEKKRMENALRESNERFRLLSEQIPDIVWCSGSDGSVEFCNSRWRQYTGLSFDETRAQGWLASIHEEDRGRTRTTWRRADETDAILEIEHRLRRADNRYFWHLTRAFKFTDASSRVVKWFGTSTNIEAQKRSQAFLEEERALRERFVSTLTHDLRNPLAAARASLELITRFPEKADIQRKLITGALFNIDRTDQMIRDLLDANRVRAGKPLPLDVHRCDLRFLAESTIQELSLIHGSRAKNDSFRFEARGTLEGYWSGKDIRRVIENLVNNAVKYGDHEHPVSVSILDLGERIRLSVTNYGNPIPKDEQSRLFEQFERSRSAESSGKRGWGLGLTLVRGIAIAHGGSVSMHSSPEAGTTFTVELPRDSRPFVS